MQGFDENFNIITKFIGPSIYTEDNLFFYSATIINFLRDVLFVAVELILNVFVLYELKKYMDRKKRRSNQQSIVPEEDKITDEKKVISSKVKRNNIIISICLGLSSALLHLTTFVIYFLLIKPKDYTYYVFFLSSACFINGIKHSLNLIIFYVFSSKFRRGFSYVYLNNIKSYLK